VARFSLAAFALAASIGLFALLALAPAPVAAQQTPAASSGAAPQLRLPPSPGPKASLSTDFSPATRAPESGPFEYVITVTNIGLSAGWFSLQCTDQSQLPCLDPDPMAFYLDSAESQEVTVSYRTLGLGRFQQQHMVQVEELPGDSITVEWITVEGTPIQTHVSPLPGQMTSSGDSLKAIFQHESGVVSQSFRVLIDGRDSSLNAQVTPHSILLSTQDLLAGNHVFTSYGCAVNGRCDSLSTTFVHIGPSTTWELDDSLPIIAGEGRFGTLPGALPLPPIELRGCPVEVGDPEIWLSSPFTYIFQPEHDTIPAGYIFWASVNWDDTIVITATTASPADTNRTCSILPWLEDSQYDWDYWLHSDPDDPMWETYPYDDRGAALRSVSPAPAVAARPVAGRAAGGLGPHHPLGVLRTQLSPQGGGGGVRSAAAGPIDPQSYWVTLNGDTIIKNGAPVPGKGAWLGQLAASGSTFYLPASAPGVFHYNPEWPDSSPNGGWNELVVSIADSTQHRTSLRARFVVPKAGSVADIAITPLRDSRHLAQEDCAAFGPFQCGGVTLAHAIPGFVSRDRDRSLHLVYRSASQRALTILPYQIDIDRLQWAPDSLLVFLRDNGALQDSGLWNHYAGKAGGATGDQLLDEYSNETRIVGGALAAPASLDAFGPVTVTVRGYYPDSTIHENTLTQDVTRLYWTDTTRTRFGLGWNLAEQARLVFITPQGQAPAAIYATGDGSHTVFRNVGGVWVAPPGETARLVAQADASDTTAYVLHFPDGTALGFQGDGRQTYARDIIGNKTKYEWGPGSRLTAIGDTLGFRYEFTYNGPRVSYIKSRYNGGTLYNLAYLAYDTLGRLTSIRNYWDGTHSDTTRFGYQTGAPGAFLDSVRDARGQVTTFGYDSRYFTAASLVRPPQAGGVRDTARFRDVWQRAVPRAGRGRAREVLERLVYGNQLRGTYVPFAGYPTDYRADRFGGPTWVRHVSPEPIMTPDWLVITFGGDDVRDIERDSTGHVTKIVAARDSAAIADSVMYEYDSRYNLIRMIQPTAQWPAGASTLDTTRFVYDTASAGLPFANQRCVRLRARYDALGVRADTVIYGTSGVAQCLPVRIVGSAADTTRLTYGSLQPGSKSTTRPTSVTDPVGRVETYAYTGTGWNLRTVVRTADNATTTFYQNAFGRTDSLMDPMGVRTVTLHDRFGRVYLQRTGTSAGAPVTATHFGKGGLVDSVRVYGTSGAVSAAPTTAVQLTRYAYNALGWLDSTVSPGGRVQRYLRDRLGNPYFEFVGNGSWVGRVLDWQGRTTTEYQSEVLPGYSMDGRSFAEPQADSVYRFFNLSPGVTLSGGVLHRYTYDNLGRVAAQYDTLVATRRVFNGRGQLTVDTVTFADGARVIRTYHYNRRGQRSLMADTVRRTGDGVILGAGWTQYGWNATTGRMDTLRAYRRVNGLDSLVASVRWLYDAAGRDTLRYVRVDSTGSPLARRTAYDAVGRVAERVDSSAAGSWYRFWNTSYSKAGDLRGFKTWEPNLAGGPTNNEMFEYYMVYDSAGSATRRLLSSRRELFGQTQYFYEWQYDVFGNRRRETVAGQSSSVDTLGYGDDNQLTWHHIYGGASGAWWHDAAGNRLVRTDSSGGFFQGAGELMSYTARGQLFFSMTPTAQPGTYDYVWHWYDGSGLRVVSATKQGSVWSPGGPTAQDSTSRSYYVYDGSDVGLVLLRPHGTANWRVYQRLVSGGTDQPLAGWFTRNDLTSAQNLALVSDYQGSVRAAVKVNGTREDWAVNFSRNPYGAFLGASGSGGDGTQTNTQTGFTGASTPTATGGFTYLRNRWYDPATGRFLTQDPIGLAGGVNLYAYAGGNPVSFSDPFGLCPPCDGHPDEGRIESTVFDPTALIPIGAIGRGIAGGLRMLAAAIAEVGARDVAEVGSREIATTLVRNAGKTAAREAIEGAGLPTEQAARALTAVSRATASTSIDIIQQRSGNVLVNLTRPGRNGFQLFQSAITPGGAKTVTQFGVDAAGRFTADVKRIGF
jgi:RHS repeat-associated protein